MSVLENVEKLVEQIIREKVAQPVLAKVTQIDTNEYFCDCVELASDGSEKDIIYSRVQIPKLLASKDGGIFLAPNKGTLVLLSFLNGDRNFPIISAVMGGDHLPKSKENKLIITANGKDLGKILVSICEKVSELVTTGSPTTQTVRPDQIADWKMFIEQEIKGLFNIE